MEYVDLMKQCQQDIEQRDHPGQMRLKKGFQAMEDLLETTNDGEQRERGLHRHPVVPGTFGTQLVFLWHPVLTTKAVVGQHNTSSSELLDERMKLVVRDIPGIPIPNR